MLLKDSILKKSIWVDYYKQKYGRMDLLKCKEIYGSHDTLDDRL